MKKSTKKIIAIILVTYCLLSSVTAYAGMIGDINNDKLLSAADARIALRASVGLDKLTKAQLAVADVDSDGSVTANDARKILRAAIGLETLDSHTHSYESIVAKESTCVKKGTMLHLCECGASYTEDLPLSDHNFASGKCLNCGKADPNYKGDNASEAFRRIKNHLLEYGYKNVVSDSVSYEYEVTFYDSSVTIIYRESSDSILLRYCKNYTPEYIALNVCVAIFNNSDTVEIKTVVIPRGVIKTYSPATYMQKSAITKNTAIRYNDSTLPFSLRQFIDEYTTEGLHVALSAADNFSRNANTNLSKLGFVNY